MENGKKDETPNWGYWILGVCGGVLLTLAFETGKMIVDDKRAKKKAKKLYEEIGKDPEKRKEFMKYLKKHKKWKIITDLQHKEFFMNCSEDDLLEIKRVWTWFLDYGDELDVYDFDEYKFDDYKINK